MTSIEFLLSIWKVQCKVGEYVVVSDKKGTSWRDHIFKYDETLEEKVTNWLETNETRDLYFCPLPFNQNKRSKTAVARSQFLWSDIDEGNYKKCEPTILWESSPGRYQGLWKLPKPLPPEEAAEHSKNLAYYLGADKGGWDLTQVLRIPGTPNNKYPDKPIVKLIHSTSRVLRNIPQRPIDRWRKSLPAKLVRLIEGKAEVGKRSDILWSTWHELLDLGVPADDVSAILRESNWNKYRGRADEDERFESELIKIVGDREEKEKPTPTEGVTLRVETYSQLMSKVSANPGWMIEHWWQRGSHGILAGQPKSFKSTIGMDMLFSVASDKPFLGEFDVHYGGPVIIVQNENSDHIMQDRWQKISKSKGEVGSVKRNGSRLIIEWARELPIFMINQGGFTLDSPANLVALEELIARVRPAAVQLDPLYLMFSGDVNSAQELNPVLTWCLYIKQTYQCAIMLVHHYGKGGDGRRSGQRMLGSTTLHGWVESALYVEVQEPIDGAAVITLDREFRGAGGYDKVNLHITQGEFGNPHYEARIVEGENEADIVETILEILSGREYQSKSSVAKLAGVSRRQVDRIVDRLLDEGQVFKSGERYGTRKRQ